MKERIREQHSSTPDDPHIDVKRVAEIARLNLTQKEAEKYQKDLEEILAVFKDISSIRTEGVRPAFQPIPLKNVTRSDRVEPSPGQKMIKIKNRENGYIKGPKVV